MLQVIVIVFTADYPGGDPRVLDCPVLKICSEQNIFLPQVFLIPFVPICVYASVPLPNTLFRLLCCHNHNLKKENNLMCIYNVSCRRVRMKVLFDSCGVLRSLDAVQIKRW